MSTTSTGPSASRCRACASESASSTTKPSRCTSIAMLSRKSRSSSTTSALSAFMARPSLRVLVELDPVARGLGEPAARLAAVGALHEIAVGAELVAAAHVLGALGRGDHHHRDVARVAGAAELAQHLEAVDLRHAQIEEDHGRVQRLA